MLRVFVVLALCFALGQSVSLCASETYANAVFPASSVPGLITGTCVPGFSGTPTRNCLAAGWSTALATYCTRNICPALTEGSWHWPQTNGGASRSLTCPSGFTGAITKACANDGTWQTTSNGCTSTPCAAITQFHADWPTTSTPGLVTGTCVAGYSGTPTRNCNANGVWSPLVSACTLNRCPLDTDGFGVTWNSVGAGVVATHACFPGYTGSFSRTCGLNGVWGTTSSTCTTNACPAITQFNADWPVTSTPSIVTGTCSAGFTGTPTRPCRNGVWGALIQKCVRGVCPVDMSGTGNANWAQTASPNVASGTCLVGYVGSPTRACNADGTWGSVTNPCTLVSNPCPAGAYGLATFPQGTPGASSTGTCAAGFTGSPSRFCSNTGVWSASVSSPCTRVTCAATVLGNANVPTTNSGVTVQGTCVSGTGRVLGTCGNNGSWSHTGLCA